MKLSEKCLFSLKVVKTVLICKLLLVYFVLNKLLCIKWEVFSWPRGLMDKASDFESEDCDFESRRGHI